MAEALKLTLAQRRERVRWAKRRKQRFLAALADTCDMDEACGAADLDWIGICQLQAMDPQFAADWDAVIAAHYARLETMMLKEAGVGGGEVNPALARELLKQRGAAAAARKGPARKPIPPPAIEASVESLMARIAKLPPDRTRYDGRNDPVAALAAGVADPGRSADRGIFPLPD